VSAASNLLAAVAPCVALRGDLQGHDGRSAFDPGMRSNASSTADAAIVVSERLGGLIDPSCPTQSSLAGIVQRNSVDFIAVRSSLR
jgi:hypothetical protein